jgi:hypothetical protein
MLEPELAQVHLRSANAVATSRREQVNGHHLGWAS